MILPSKVLRPYKTWNCSFDACEFTTYFPDTDRLWDGLIFYRKIVIYDLQKLAINAATKRTKTKIRPYRETEIKIYICCLQSVLRFHAAVILRKHRVP
jgi:hypothetical protein